ncbi:MAG TPA: hypothetical protein VM782_14425 [Stellaceae bacterium]|nr:hypothetical protein [Stellaceae bacterium]
MKIQILLAGAALVAMSLPAMAEEWYVVSGPEHHCQVVSQRPATKEITVVSPDGVTYKTRTEAMDAMKTVKVCQ